MAQQAARTEFPPPGGPAGFSVFDPGELGQEWVILRDCRLRPSDRGSSPTILLHPARGVAVLDILPFETPDALDAVRGRLDAARFPAIFAGDLPVVHLRLTARQVPFLPSLLDDAFAGAAGLAPARRRCLGRRCDAGPLGRTARASRRMATGPRSLDGWTAAQPAPGGVASTGRRRAAGPRGAWRRAGVGAAGRAGAVARRRPGAGRRCHHARVAHAAGTGGAGRGFYAGGGGSGHSVACRRVRDGGAAATTCAARPGAEPEGSGSSRAATARVRARAGHRAAAAACSGSSTAGGRVAFPGGPSAGIDGGASVRAEFAAG